MPRTEKGILGVKKDPSNQILFSFGRRAEEWPSDDSDDSDYKPSDKPSDSEDELKKQRTEKLKRIVRKKPTRKRHAPIIESDSESGGSEDCIASDQSSTNSIHVSPSQKKKHKPSPSGHEHSNCSREPSRTSGNVTQQKFSQDIWGQHIPPELLLKIFQHVVNSDGALPFLCRAGKVCHLWSEISCQPILWEKLDLSYGWIKSKESTLKWLTDNRMSRLAEINLSSWKNLTHNWLEPVLQNCPLVESISLAYCEKITAETTRLLADSCPHLKSLDLTSVSSKTVNGQALKYLIEKVGSTLTHLNLSGNNLVCFNVVLNALADHCPNLKILEVCNVKFSTDFMSLNIEKLQHGCPRLHILRITNSKFRAASVPARLQAESPGFVDLEELSVAIDPEGVNIGIGMDDNFLHRLLKSSHNLRLLDLRGSSHVTNHGIQTLPVTDLQHLFLSRSSMAKYDGIEVIMQKWRHSLVELDLAWNVYPGMSLDLAMRKLSDDPSTSRIEVLNLSGTCISCSRLKSLLEGCPRLRSINLGSCRGLPRGMKREYSDKLLRHLRRNIDDIIDKEAEENS